MKKSGIFMALAAFVFAVGSAFATKTAAQSGDIAYVQQLNPQRCTLTNKPEECGIGFPQICTIAGLTYYQNVSRAQIALSQTEANGSYTLSAPPLTVNKRSCIDPLHIYILSDRMADNENEKTFRQCSVIDVYNLEDGTYRSSFYLPDYRGEKVRYFRVFNRTLFALYDHYLYTYRLNF